MAGHDGQVNVARRQSRILLVEDDESLSVALKIGLRRAGYDVHVARDSTRFEECVLRVHHDLALLDISLPNGRSGVDLARALRERSDVPIVFNAARDSLDDRLAGFEAGADDYLAKPFALSGLLVRVRAVLRRAGRLLSPVIQIRDLVIDEQQRSVTKGGEVVPLTATEFELLWTLARAPRRVYSKGQLLSLGLS